MRDNAKWPITVRPLEPGDHAAWSPLWQAYLTFYETVLPDGLSEQVWRRFFDDAETMYALGAFNDGRLVGFAHLILHRSTWAEGYYLYLEDLFVDASARGCGVGEALIEASAAFGRNRNASKLYWLTHDHNKTARRLYDRVAALSGFIHYQREL